MRSPAITIVRTAKRHPRATLSIAALAASRRKRSTRAIQLARQTADVYARISDPAVQTGVEGCRLEPCPGPRPGTGSRAGRRAGRQEARQAVRRNARASVESPRSRPHPETDPASAARGRGRPVGRRRLRSLETPGSQWRLSGAPSRSPSSGSPASGSTRCPTERTKAADLSGEQAGGAFGTSGGAGDMRARPGRQRRALPETPEISECGR